MDETGYVVQAKDICKSFSGVEVLKKVDLSIKKGEIHCLAGENGCGKSTLVKIIAGIYSLDSGSLEINGQKYENIQAIQAIREGIQVIYQDFSVFPNLSVAENIALSNEIYENNFFVNKKKIKQIAGEVLKELSLSLDLNREVSRLPVAEKQLVAIARGISNRAKLIIMDEPTSALTQKEIERLFEIIRELSQKGISILFISHKIDEVYDICDNVTILRNGENVITAPIKEVDPSKFVFYMTGRELNKIDIDEEVKEEVVLEVQNLTLKDKFEDVSFSVHRGEVLGITGLLGSGRTELAKAIFGMYSQTKGIIRIDGKEISVRTIQSAMKTGIGYVPEDRLTEGLFFEQTITDNIIVGAIKRFGSKVGILQKSTIADNCNDWKEKLQIKCNDLYQLVETLSGGNQQKIVLARWLTMDPKILILNGPTVGVDIGAKFDIHMLIRELARKGIAILVISDDVPELLNTCNRIIAMHDGKVSGEVQNNNLEEAQVYSMLK